MGSPPRWVALTGRAGVFAGDGERSCPAARGYSGCADAAGGGGTARPRPLTQSRPVGSAQPAHCPLPKPEAEPGGLAYPSCGSRNSLRRGQYDPPNFRPPSAPKVGQFGDVRAAAANGGGRSYFGRGEGSHGAAGVRPAAMHSAWRAAGRRLAQQRPGEPPLCPAARLPSPPLAASRSRLRRPLARGCGLAVAAAAAERREVAPAEPAAGRL